MGASGCGDRVWGVLTRDCTRLTIFCAHLAREKGRLPRAKRGGQRVSGALARVRAGFARVSG